MDPRSYMILAVLALYCIASAFSAGTGEQYSNSQLERHLRSDILSQIAHLEALERSLIQGLEGIHEKKRQLEIKKRSPIQCLVNLVSCWKK